MKLRIPPPVVCDRGSERAAAAIWDGTEHVLMGARLSAVVGRVVYHIPFFVQKAYGGHSAATGGWTERRFPKLERHQSRFRRGPRFWRGEELNLDMVVLFYLLIPFPVPNRDGGLRDVAASGPSTERLFTCTYRGILAADYLFLLLLCTYLMGCNTSPCRGIEYDMYMSFCYL